MTTTTARPDTPPGFVVLSTSCWCCGQVLQKQVPRTNRDHRHFAWQCTPCDVAWTGPGD